MKNTYYEKFKDPRWQRKRLEIMERANFECEYCGENTQTLNVHHLLYYKGKDPWEYENKFLKCFCETCHENWHIDHSLLLGNIAELESHGGDIQVLEWLLMWKLNGNENALDALMRDLIGDKEEEDQLKEYFKKRAASK